MASGAHGGEIAGALEGSGTLSGGVRVGGTVSGGTAGAGTLGGSGDTSGSSIGGAVVVDGLLSGGIPVLGDVSGAGDTSGSGVSGGEALAGTIEDGARLGGRITGAEVVAGDLTGGIVVNGLMTGGLGGVGTLTGGLAPTLSSIEGGERIGGSTISRGKPLAGTIGFVFDYAWILELGEEMDIHYRTLCAEDALVGSLAWFVGQADALNAEKRIAYATVPYGFANGSAIIRWDISGLHTNTSGTATWDILLYGSNDAMPQADDTTPFYTFRCAGIPTGSGGGAFAITIEQLIFNYNAGANNQNIRSMGFFNTGPVAFPNLATHTVFDVSRVAVSGQNECKFERDRRMSLAIKKIAGSSTSMRVDRISCVATVICSGGGVDVDKVAVIAGVG